MRSGLARSISAVTECGICQVRPASGTLRHTSTLDTERVLHHCKSCGDLVGCSEDSWPSPATVRGVLGVLEGLRQAPLEGVNLRGKGREDRATRVLMRSLHAQKTQGNFISWVLPPPPVRTLFSRSARKPDACVQGRPSGSLIAVEIKVTQDDSRESAETDRGLGQCVRYGLGFGTGSESERYGAAVLVTVRLVRSKQPTGTRMVDVLEVRPRWDEIFWIYHVRRDVSASS